MEPFNPQLHAFMHTHRLCYNSPGEYFNIMNNYCDSIIITACVTICILNKQILAIQLTYTNSALSVINNSKPPVTANKLHNMQKKIAPDLYGKMHPQ